MNITFLGAAREVTGSCFFVETDRVRFLVDCGMIQGGREASLHNHQPFAFDPQSIDFVLLTHAHIDHSGLLTLIGMLTPLCILAEVMFGAPLLLVLVGGIAMPVAMAWFGVGAMTTRPTVIADKGYW